MQSSLSGEIVRKRLEMKFTSTYSLRLRDTCMPVRDSEEGRRISVKD